MSKLDILKLIGVLIGTFLLMLVGAFFLYPYVNEENHEAVISTFETNYERVPGNDEYIGREFEHLNYQVDSLRNREDLLLIRIDSLQEANGSLREELENMADKIIESQQETVQNSVIAANEEFAERVKSLLNLDEEELGPIIERMSKEQLVRLYREGGNIQREKILRSLQPDRAAELIQEVML